MPLAGFHSTLWIFTYPNWSGPAIALPSANSLKTLKRKKGGGPRHHRCDHTRPGYCRFDARQKANNYLASIYYTNANLHGLAFIDISTGEFVLTETDTEGLTKLMDGFQPSEVIYPRGFQAYTDELFGSRYYTYALDDWIFGYDFARERLPTPLRCKISRALGRRLRQWTNRGGAILHYLGATQNKNTGHINSIQRLPSNEFMWLDRFTIRNLELVQCIHDSGKSLLDVLDHTSSAMGGPALCANGC